MNVRKALIFFFLMICFVFLVYAIIAFFSHAESTGCDLIALFDTAEKKNFNPDFNLDICFPDKAFSYDIKILREKLANLFSNNIAILSKNGISKDQIQVSVDSAAFRLIFPSENGKRSFIFKFKIKDSNNFYKIEVLSEGIQNRILIDRIKNGNHELIDDFNYEAQSTDNNVLVIAFFRDYLVILNDDFILYQQKDDDLQSSGKIAFDYNSKSSHSSKFTVKYAEISDSAEEELINVLKWSHPNLRDHKFNINDIAWNPPSFREFITESDKRRIFIRRAKIGAEVRPVIYFPINSSLEYKIRIPDNAHMEFHLALIPENVHKMERIRFIVQIAPSNGDVEDEQIIKFPLGKTNRLRFTKFDLDLSKFGGQKISLRIRFETIDGFLKSNEKKILLACGSPAIYGGPLPSGVRNIILISLDTLRADHLGCYDYFRDTSPNLDKAAKEGTVFYNAASCSNWTLPSHMSMLTGLYPSETGYIEGHAVSNTFFGDDVETIASYLRTKSYKTAGFHGGGYMSEYFGFDKGFDSYSNTHPEMTDAMDQVLRWLKNNKHDKFFLFFHTYETHAPYKNKYFLSQLPPVSSKPVDRSIAAYDSDIHNADLQLGRLFEWLKKNNLYEQTVIIITSDHGENFDYVKKEGDPGTHGKTLYDSEMRIPLIIRGGDFTKGKVIKSQVSSVDILPTILNNTGLEAKDDIRGIDLSKLLEKDDLGNRLVYMESSPPSQILRGVRSSNYKLIARNYTGLKTSDNKMLIEYEFFDLSSNSRENNNIWTSQTSLAKKYMEQLKKVSSSVSNRGYSRAGKQGRTKIMDDELQEQLKALGYLGN